MNTKTKHGARTRSELEAVVWFTRLTKPDLPVRYWKHWKKWHAIPTNRAAFEAVLAIRDELDRLPPDALSEICHLASHQSDARISIGSEQGLHPVAPPPATRSFRAMPWLIAASTAALAAGVALWLVLLMPSGPTFETSSGKWRNEMLSDGSLVSLGPKTRLEVRFDDERRLVQLLRGEALFRVAKEPERPFIVETNLATARAVGTAFAVSVDDREMRVTVAEGVVEVAGNGRSSGVDGPKRISLAANQQASVSQNLKITVRHVDAQEVLRQAVSTRIASDNREVAEVVEEFNRRNEMQIRILDEAISKRRVTGLFDATDPRFFAGFLEHQGNVVVVDEDDATIYVVPYPTNETETPAP